MNRYLQYNLTHKQIALVMNNYFKFDGATGKLVSQWEQFCFCTHIYQHHLENLSYQTHTKLWTLKSLCKDTFSTKQLSKTIVACSTLRVKKRANQLIATHINSTRSIVFILNVTRYAAQVNRQQINIIMDKVDKTGHDVNNLYNLTTSLATSLSYYQLILHIRSVLANLLGFPILYQNSFHAYYGLHQCSH